MLNSSWISKKKERKKEKVSKYVGLHQARESGHPLLELKPIRATQHRLGCYSRKRTWGECICFPRGFLVRSGYFFWKAKISMEEKKKKEKLTDPERLISPIRILISEGGVSSPA
jgi:hypothetical protein